MSNIKRILITGGSGFIAKSIIASQIFKNHQVWYPSHDVLDLMDLPYLRKQLELFKPDIIINTAYLGASYANNTEETCAANIKMLQNLMECKDLYSKLIIFGSGIEFQNEDDVRDSMIFYRQAKLVNALMARGQDYIIKLNLWNVFGVEEHKNRFISTCIKNCKENKDIIIPENKMFDFFYIHDLIKLIEYLIANAPNIFIEMDICYNVKYWLNDIALAIKILTKSSSNIIIKSQTDRHYLGNRDKRPDFGLNFKGIHQGLAEMINDK